MEPLRILLVDDHVLFRKGVAALLAARQEMDVVVVGEAGDGLEAIAQARETVPDVILMDIHMPECDGLEPVRVIKREMPHVHIIMLTVSDDDRDLFAAIKNGAEGYLLKNLEPYQLFEMLEGVRQGETAISGTMAAKILQEFRQPTQNAAQEPEARDELTPREIEVLERVVEGATNKEIAEALSVTENTVKIHLRNILEKLHLQNRIQAAVYAVREGLVDDPSQRQ
jgi:two-component system nitrate/nitrite response regulator NarL